MIRLEAFEAMLSDIQKQAEYETEQMERLKAAGKEKTATYRQYLGNRMLYKKCWTNIKSMGCYERYDWSSRSGGDRHGRKTYG